MLITSLRWRLELWLACVLVCVLGGFGVTIYELYRISELNRIDEELQRRVAVLSGAVRGGPPPAADLTPPPSVRAPGEHAVPEDGRHPPLPEDFLHAGRRGPFGPRDFEMTPTLARLFDQADPIPFYFAVWSRDGALFKQSSGVPADLSRPERPDIRDTRTHTRTRAGHRQAFHFTELGDAVLVGHSLAGDLAALHRFAMWLFAAGSMVLALALGGGWLLMTRAIGPVEDISAAATRISAGNLSERIEVEDAHSELGRLAGVLNTTFARLEASFRRQQQFTADASHELRTPLAVIISGAQASLARKRRGVQYRETIAVCLEAAQQIRRLTDSMLELARFDAGEEHGARRSLDIADHARRCVERLRPLASEREIDIHGDLEPAGVTANSDRLERLITNLLTNAIHYNKRGGRVRIDTRLDGAVAVVTVADTGQGIAPEDLPHIFERFYRTDRSRSRAEGHSGLGLAICKAIVDAEEGRIDVTSQLGIGTTFTVRLPFAARPDPPRT